jgi:hypothetical protein
LKYHAIPFTLTLQKSKLLQIQDAEGDALVIYCESLATLIEDPANSGEMRHLRLSHWANNMAGFTIFTMLLGSIPSKQRKSMELLIIIEAVSKPPIRWLEPFVKR